jgi:hypothetical protein
MKPMDKCNTVVATACGLAIAVLLAGNPSSAHAAQPAAPAGSAEAATPLFDMLDANKDHALSRQEFQSGYPGLQRLIAAQLRLREQFGALDANRNGAIDAGEYASLELIRRRGQAAPPMSAFDIDHDQKLGFAEYATLVRRLATAQAPAKK